MVHIVRAYTLAAVFALTFLSSGIAAAEKTAAQALQKVEKLIAKRKKDKALVAIHLDKIIKVDEDKAEEIQARAKEIIESLLEREGTKEKEQQGSIQLDEKTAEALEDIYTQYLQLVEIQDAPAVELIKKLQADPNLYVIGVTSFPAAVSSHLAERLTQLGLSFSGSKAGSNLTLVLNEMLEIDYVDGIIFTNLPQLGKAATKEILENSEDVPAKKYFVAFPPNQI